MELTNYVVEIVFSVVGLVGLFVLTKLKVFIEDKTGVEIDKGLTNYFKDAINYAEGKTKKKANELTDEVDIENEKVRMAVEYIYNNAPEWLNKLGFTEKMVRNKVESMLYDKQV